MNPREEHPLNALMEQASEEERKKQTDGQKVVRTLEGDIQEAIQKKNASTASMVMSQQAQASSLGTQKKQPSNFNKKILLISASVLLVVFGTAGALYFFIKSGVAPNVPVAMNAAPVPSIVSPDAQKILDITGQSQESAKTALGNELTSIKGGNGSILQIIPVQKGNTGAENMMDASDFMFSIGLYAPDVLSRSLNGQWMLGTYSDNGTAAPFMILKNNFFQNAYAGMIAWEKTLPDDFISLFGYANKADEQEGTSTLASYFTIEGSFKDGVIENKDVRAFSKPDGTLLILYSFVDNNTIVITTDENALAGIINRLEKQTFIR